jgi:hypothetical protein
VSEKKIFVVDSQILNTAQECERKANWTFGVNLEPLTKPSYFEKGDLIHQILSAYYNMRKYRSRWHLNNKTHADIVHSCVIIGRRAAIQMNLDIEDVEEVIHTFCEYATYRAADGWDNVVAVEEVGSKILYEDEQMLILYQFKIDLVLNLMNCNLMPVDHKSSSRRTRANEMSNQFKGYCWGLGVNNIIVNKIGFQKTLKPSEKFTYETISYQPDIISEWIEISTYYLKRYIRHSETGFFPPNFTSCDKYSGCLFREICNKAPSGREYKLAQLFQERRHWDVGAQDK